MKTYHLHIKGRVQGVGFRPFVYRLAEGNDIKGRVRNDPDGVHVYFNSDNEPAAADFIEKLIYRPPANAIIKSYHSEQVERVDFKDFGISPSNNNSAVELMITPDLAICQKCRQEISDPANRRHNYAFITCTQCGPRYSIIDGLPYDRPLTTMDRFMMCEKCDAEYKNILDRRHYSQTNSCPSCAVRMSLFNNTGELLSIDQNSIPGKITELLSNGNILAIKGIGGYLLVADATDRLAVQKLRERKRRPRKPFALMYPSIDLLKNDAELSPATQRMLLSPASPIVLVELKNIQASGLCCDMIAPGLTKIGVMMPYTGLYDILLGAFGKPVVATSGNVSDSPIIYNNEAAIETLSAIADFIVTNDRDIAVPQDDSVVRLTPKYDQPVILRRSRGLAPSMKQHPFQVNGTTWLGYGADLKGSFAILTRNEIYSSQYLGNLEFPGSQRSFRHTLNHLKTVLQATPDKILVDMHPGYLSTEMGRTFAREHNLIPVGVQHHEAHFAAVLAENNLLETQQPVLGVIWDGTGYGRDGQIWGGEFFTYANHDMVRRAHFKYFDQKFGDKMSREPRLSAFSLCGSYLSAQKILEPKFTSREWAVYRKTGDGMLKTSSVGRIFDAIASITGLCDKMDYEGEAAMYLEQEAAKHFQVHGKPENRYLFIADSNGTIDHSLAIRQILADVNNGCETGEIACKFHYSLAALIADLAISLNTKHIAFSGGVFQNAFLVDCCIELLGDTFNLHFHRELSPNDENIGYGQIAYAYIDHLRKTKFNKLN